jgi:hypothetical protein
VDYKLKASFNRCVLHAAVLLLVSKSRDPRLLSVLDLKHFKP